MGIIIIKMSDCQHLVIGLPCFQTKPSSIKVSHWLGTVFINLG